MAKEVNLSQMKGEDKVWTVTLDGNPNITGWAITFVLKKRLGDSSALITKTVGSGIVLTTPTTGIFTVTIAAADTNASTVGDGKFRYEIFRSDAGAIDVLDYGEYEIKPRV